MFYIREEGSVILHAIINLFLQHIYLVPHETKEFHTVTNEAYGVVKSVELPLQSFPVKKNVVHGGTKKSIEKQHESVVYEIPSILPQQKQNIDYHYDELKDYL